MGDQEHPSTEDAQTWQEQVEQPSGGHEPQSVSEQERGEGREQPKRENPAGSDS